MSSVFHKFRFPLALIGGVIIAIGLFLLMHELISGHQSAKNVAPDIELVSFVHVQHTPEVTHKNRVQPPPPPPKQPPPPSRVQTQVSTSMPTRQLPVNVKFNASSLGSGAGVFINPRAGGGGTGTGGYAPLTPMVRFRPLYPPRAQARGVEGVITTCFTVNADGTVSSPYVSDASSPLARRMLGQAALKTIRQWKFFPKKENGKPVATSGVCQDIKFTIQ